MGRRALDSRRPIPVADRQTRHRVELHELVRRARCPVQPRTLRTSRLRAGSKTAWRAGDDGRVGVDLGWYGDAEHVRMLIAHEALVSPREEPVGRSALGGGVADVDRYLPRRWTHCSQHRCFQPRRLVPGRCYRERWRPDLGGLHEGHIDPVVGWCTHSGGACAGRHDVPGWSDCLDSRASTGRPVGNRLTGRDHDTERCENDDTERSCSHPVPGGDAGSAPSSRRIGSRSVTGHVRNDRF